MEEWSVTLDSDYSMLSSSAPPGGGGLEAADEQLHTR